MSGKVNRDHFYRLASHLQDERVQAAVSLIEELSALDLPKYNEEWSYVLRRLILGLSSGRDSARLGFSLCLSEVINLALEKGNLAPENLSTPDQYLKLLSSTLTADVDNGKNKKETKGKDERGILFGKLFGLQALLSEPLFKRVFFDKEGKVSQFTLSFAQEVTRLALKKNWLRESCLYTLFQTLRRLAPAMKSETVNSLLLLLDKYRLTMTNEGLAIYLLLLHGGIRNDGKSFKVPTSLVLQFPAWEDNDPLLRSNLSRLSSVLVEAMANERDIEDTLHLTSSNWAPRLHFVWDVLIPIVAREKSDEEISSKKHRKKKRHVAERIEFPEFWKAIVDETFFDEKASSERKYCGFLIFIKTVEIVPSRWIPSCFTRNLMRTLINQSTDPGRLLNKISRKALDAIVKACQGGVSDVIVLCLETILFGPHGSINFDKLTKSRTASKILAIKDIPDSGLDKLFKMLSMQLDRDGQSGQHYQFLLDTILYVVRNHRHAITSAITLDVPLESIVKLAFFSKKNGNISDLAKERLFSILSELGIRKAQPSWQHYVLKLILSKEEQGNELINKMDDSLKAVKSEALEILGSISSETDPQFCGFEGLLSNCLLQLYSGGSESLSIIEELCAFYHQGLRESNSLVGITEIILSLLAQKKALLRKLSLAVWEQFVGEVSDQELKMLTEILNTRENREGFAKLFENMDDYQEESTEGEQDLEDSGSRITSSGKKSNHRPDDAVSSTSEEDFSNDSREDDDSNVAEIDREATSALAKVLNLPDNIVNDRGEIDVEMLESENGIDSAGADDDDEEEEESMDDEQMMKLDEQLSCIFKQRKHALSGIRTGNERKLEAKEARASVITFKHRIVEMLEFYIKHVDRISLRNNDDGKERFNSKDSVTNLFLLIGPMIRCLKLTLDRPLAVKISKVLKGRLYRINMSTFRDIIDEECIFQQLKSTHEALLTSKPGQFPALYFSICSSTSLFLGKILVQINSKNPIASYARIIDLYADTAKQWMLRGKFGTNVFSDFHNWLFSRKNTQNQMLRSESCI